MNVRHAPWCRSPEMVDGRCFYCGAVPDPTVTDFVLARIAEDEAAAEPFRNPLGHVKAWRADEVGAAVRQIGPSEFGLDDVISRSNTHLEADHIARHDPARVLAQCAAMLKIVERFTGINGCDACGAVGRVGDIAHEDYCGGDVSLFDAEATLRALASIWSDHPDWREEWRA